LQTWKTQILAALGENAQVIIELIPELEGIIGTQPPAPELSGTAAQNRFNLLFQRFIQVFTTAEHPLVIFVDDLQWADSASLNLIQVLMSESKTGHLLLLGAYRDNEVFPAHPLMLTLNDIAKAGATIETITLQPLNLTSLNYLVADTLHAPEKVVKPLTELAMQKTQGNPFFATQFLKVLHQEQLITFDRDAGHWQCDIVQVRDAALTSDVVEFMALQLQKLPEVTQEILKLAACIGAQFDLETLAIVSEQPQTAVATALWKALQEGLILPQSEIYKFYIGEAQVKPQDSNELLSYKFLHDRVQQAAYSLILEAQKPVTHVRIGRLLLENTAPEALEERIFELVGQLNYGIDTIARAEEQEELACLNLIACRKAKNATAYRAGREYACKGLSLLGNNPWQKQYEMTLALSELAAEFAALCGEWEEMDRLVGETIANSHSLAQQANVYRIQIQANVSRNQPTEAIKIALGFLQQLGVTFPENPTGADIGKAIVAVQKLMAEREVEDLLNLPAMKDEEKIAIVQTANSILPATYICNPLLFPIVACLSVSLSIQYGNIPPSSYAYVSYGLILANSANPDVITGDRFCRLALQLVDKLDAKIDKAAVLTVSGLFLIHRTSPMQETLPLLQAAYTNGLETGSYEFAGYGGYNFCAYSFWCNRPLAPLAEETRAYCHGLTQINQLTTANYARIYWQGTLNCLDRSENPTLLSGEAMEEKEALLQWQAANDGCGLFFFHTCKLMLCYLFGEIESARNHGIEARRYLMAGAGFVVEPAFYFYDSLTMLASFNFNSEEIAQVFEKVRQNQRILQEQWANYAPMNYQHKVDLVAAEKCRVSGEKLEAMELYDQAITGAKANEYIQEEALANELFAKFYLDWGRDKEAAGYMQEAYYCYARWGAKAKTDHLEANYPQLLRPILQKTSSTLHPLETLASISSLKSTICSTTTGTHTSTSNANTALDLVTLFKAAQAISSTIDLDELLRRLTQILLHNSGGDRCAIILCEPNKAVQVRAIATVNATDLSSVTLKDATHLPVKLIHYVKNSGKTVVMDSPKSHLPVVDHDLAERQPASVLCLPLVDRSQLRGILYLENQATSGVFHPERLAALQLLATQAAIALENARLYQQAQDYAQQLEESQLQLVQSEKMSALGNLVAGVAHEINNPLGFINGNITEVRHCLDDITECLQCYRQTFPQPGEEIEALLEELEIDFLIEDLPNMLDSMKVGCDRIRGISTSLRMFSRADTESKFRANVHDGIDSTLLILKYRLKAKDFRPEIEVIRNYGNLPEINCFPGQLNQVFMNILANAIDMFDEIAEGQSFEELQASPQQITIQTQVVEPNSIEIHIRDNGKGISEEICSKIFDRKFTTKAVGKGTGLGLAIARQVIVEKHSGQPRRAVSDR
jgi:predicted ATPase/signal transduction histidine kinase